MDESTDRTPKLALGTALTADMPARALALCALMLSLTIVQPLSSDNAVIHSIAFDAVYKGAVPYLQSWDQTFPGIMLVHIVSILIFGPSAIGFRILDCIIHLVFVFAWYRLLRRWLTAPAASLAIVLYCAYYTAGGWYVYGQHDEYGMMAVLLGIGFLLGDEPPSLSRIAVAMLTVGISFVMRPTFLLYLGLASLLVGYRTEGALTRKLLYGLAAILIGCVPLLIVLAFYATKQGGLEAFVNSTIRWNLDLYTGLGGNPAWKPIARSGLLIPFAVLPLITRTSFSIWRAPKPYERWLEFALILCTVFILVLMGKYWPYHFPPLFLCIIPLSAMGLESIRTRFRTRRARTAFTLIAVLLCSFAFYNPLPLFAFVKASVHHENPLEAAAAVRMQKPEFAYDDQKALITFLEQPGREHARVELWTTFKPWLRLALGTRPVGPYVTFHGILFQRRAHDSAVFTPYQQEWQRNYLNILQRTPPEYIVLERNTHYWYMNDIYQDGLSHVAGIDSFFRTEYAEDTSFGNFYVYRRQSKTPAITSTR